jgi:hypothetical protein
MPTARVTANTTAQTLFTTPKHVVGRITAIDIDNQSGASRTIRIQDIFTPDPSVGVSSPSEQTIERFQATVENTKTLSVDEDALKDIRILGVAKAIADGVSTGCVIIVNYHFE